MIRSLFLRYGVIAAAVSAMALLGPATQAGVSVGDQSGPAVAALGHPTSVITIEPGQRDTAAEPVVGIQAWPTPSRRSYHITSSCQPYAAAIRRGAAAWTGLTEGAGTPVSCTNSYITGCGGGTNVVGCNWGSGQRISLFMRGVRDGALLAAHEFGHNWFGHSGFRCAGWGSAQEVMAPSMCG
ncbi:MULTISPECIES: hypothetical protein [unclassified Crossiella]|uniref:hypothetical protein n=1 Tax=unclassified Crossiella TaxID=2620835 RepID=UPI001FFF8F2F|nr:MULTISPECIES: hypothetical protein [unclassified Crossiella]MCK2244098.1 hypothetical protein [Crossiella sp. S99.2]MCK2257902.1 hypothetical protein [Crossiella sp. S99.1]